MDSFLLRLIGVLVCVAGAVVVIDVKNVNELWRSRVYGPTARTPPLLVFRLVGAAWLVMGLWLVAFLGAPVL